MACAPTSTPRVLLAPAAPPTESRRRRAGPPGPELLARAGPPASRGLGLRGVYGFSPGGSVPQRSYPRRRPRRRAPVLAHLAVALALMCCCVLVACSSDLAELMGYLLRGCRPDHQGHRDGCCQLVDRDRERLKTFLSRIGDPLSPALWRRRPRGRSVCAAVAARPGGLAATAAHRGARVRGGFYHRAADQTATAFLWSRSCASSVGRRVRAGSRSRRGNLNRRIRQIVRGDGAVALGGLYSCDGLKSAHRQLGELGRTTRHRRRTGWRWPDTTRRSCVAPCGRLTMRRIRCRASYMKQRAQRRIVQPRGWAEDRARWRAPGPPARAPPRDDVLDLHDLNLVGRPPAGFIEIRAARSWRLLRALPTRIADRGPLLCYARTRRLPSLTSPPGAPAAPGGNRLRLLPSGPDLVREPTSRGTRTINAPEGRSDRSRCPSTGLQPR